MERIKQALERAKKERESAQGTRPAFVHESMRRPSPSRGDKIVYSETRVFVPDPAVLNANRVLGGEAAGPATDAYRMLRTRVLQRMRDNGWTSLMITSPGVGEGKSLTSVNLAISLAREVTHTVLLVDLDLRRPSLHEFFGFKPEHGVADVILKRAPISKVLFNPSVERLVVLPGHERVENSSEMLSTPEMLDVIADIKSRYPERIVLFDMPPVLSTDDALAFSPNVDAALLVVEQGGTDQDDLAAVYEVLAGTSILGVVLNKAEEFASAYY